MRGTNHRVLFQNLDGNINMGVRFDDPNIDYYDICLFNFLAQMMEVSLGFSDELISEDDDLQTKSCYSELQRNRVYSKDIRLKWFIIYAN